MQEMSDDVKRDLERLGHVPDGQAVQAEMPRYQSHKKVWALKLARIDLEHSVGQVLLHPEDPAFAPIEQTIGWYGSKVKDGETDPGYYVVYEDGYASWSPTQAFEEGYTRLTVGA